MRFSRLAQAFACAFTIAAPAFAVSPDHHEFEAALEAPFLGTHGQAREFALRFDFPDATDPSIVAWRMELLTADDKVIQTWYGEERLFRAPIEVRVPWDGNGLSKARLSDGIYGARMTAVSVNPSIYSGKIADRVARFAAAVQISEDAPIEQRFDVQVGNPPKPVMPAFKPLPTNGELQSKSAPAIGSLPYTVYFGNLHSQTNHSDGGGVIASCTGAQNPQSAPYGPTDAYNYALGRGLDILMTSEHNHMFDGSDATNANAVPATAHNLYQSGLSAASSFNAAHSNFLAVYGMEWGVISNGGHMNIFNSNELLGWEYNGSNQLISDTYTAKSDYAALYTLMKSRGWIGQFNHPASSGQFLIGSTPLAYSADGDQVMVLAELSNSSAFSTNTTETETSRSNYESAFKILLERGYHVAPSSDQDNHCAQWGASYTNRTAVLIPNGTALSMTSFLDALKARRVYATHDKTAQLILTANGHVMGERFNNSGSLTLTANYASTSGHSASQVEIYEGVPGRNGTVTQLSTTAVTTITPANGEHFYYAKITQNNGDLMWSAPVWVSQGGTGNASPSANFNFAGSNLAVNFTDSSTDSDGTIASRAWNFGDGGTSTAANPTHTYAALGTYNVQLTVTDNGGATSSITKAVPVTQSTNAPPVANFSFTSSGLTATFTDSSTDSDGTIASRSWNFGDSTTSTTTSPSHTYAAAGTYSVALTVTDNGGATNTKTQSVIVSNTSTVLTNGVAKTGLSGAAGANLNFTMVVPAGATGLKFVITGGTGDADMYVKFGSAPTSSSYDCRPYLSGNAETCNIATAQAGTYYVMLNGYQAFSGVSLTGSYTAGSGPLFQNTTSMAINDNTTITSSIAVSGVTGNAPAALKVGVSIHHTYQGDLKVDLIAPNGTTFNLWNRTGAGTDNIIQTFTVNASAVTANGTWKLQVNDNAAGDTGTLDNWSLQF